MKGFTADDVMGKPALDPNGAILGVVVKLHVDPQKKDILGVTVDQGFFKPDLYVGIVHVKRFGVDAVFLSTAPYENLEGLGVLTYQGVSLGVVRKVNLEGSKLTHLTVAGKVAGKTHLVEVKAGEIKEVGETIILKKGAEREEEELRLKSEKEEGTKG